MICKICLLQGIIIAVSENFIMIGLDSTNNYYHQEQFFFCTCTQKVLYFRRKCTLLMCYLNFFSSQGKWDVPLPKVKAVGEDEVFKVIKTGRSKSKSFGVQFFPRLLCYSVCMWWCKLASLGCCSSANKQNETVIRWRTLSKSICVVKNDFFHYSSLEDM